MNTRGNGYDVMNHDKRVCDKINDAAQGERSRDLEAGWSPKSVCAGPVGVRTCSSIH